MKLKRSVNICENLKKPRLKTLTFRPKEVINTLATNHQTRGHHKPQQKLKAEANTPEAKSGGKAEAKAGQRDWDKKLKH